VELRYLLYFATVAENQSFTRAAEKLNIAQPAISQQIRTLEEELEVKLLIRTKRSVRLTAAGQAFLCEAKDILNRVEESRAHARRAAQGATGRLSIGCVGWTASLFLPGLIYTYRTRSAALDEPLEAVIARLSRARRRLQKELTSLRQVNDSPSGDPSRTGGDQNGLPATQCEPHGH
jgi:DNA-binding transcriptional LysR family regulator